MHTIMVVGGGLLLLGICLIVGRVTNPASGLASGAIVFIPTWLLTTVVNMWFGVSRAGYSVAEELPIFAMLFGSLTVVALIIWWRFRQGA